MRGQVLALVSLVPAALAAPSLPRDLGLRDDALINVVSSTIWSTVYICPSNTASSIAASSSANAVSTNSLVVAPSTTPSSSAPVVIAPNSTVPTSFSQYVTSSVQSVVAPSAISLSSTPVAVAPTSTASVTYSKPVIVTSSTPTFKTTKPVITTSTPPTTIVSSSSPASTAGGAGYSGKIQKGVVYQGDKVLLEILNKTTGVEFIIDWSPVRPNVALDIEFMPQLWEPPATGDVSLATFQGGTAKAVAAGSKWLLSWGEQEKKDYTLMAQDFMSILQPEAQKLGLKVAAPSVLQNPMSHNKPWLTDFLDTCDALGCKISALTAHYWAPTGDPTWFRDFQNYVNAIAEIRPNLPLFIDNLSMNGTAAQQLVFLQEVLPWATAHDNIARIGLIPGGTGQGAFDTDGNLNELGSYWFGA